MATTATKQQQQSTVVRSVSTISAASNSSVSRSRSSSPSSSASSYLNTSSSATIEQQQQQQQLHQPKIIYHNHHRSSSSISSTSPTQIGLYTNFYNRRSPSPGSGGDRIYLSSHSAPQTPSDNFDGDEDIASIAKQISDHAEAIYQTWKARGLAPTEILNCPAGDLGGFLGRQTGIPQPPNIRSNLESPVADFLAHNSSSSSMSNNNLEKLVSSFVNEDKARQATRLTKSFTTPSSPVSTMSTSANSLLTSGTIRDALKKFESNNGSAGSNASQIGGYVKPNFLISKGYTSPNKVQSQLSAKSSMQSQLSKSVPDVLIDTINTAKNAEEKLSLKSPITTSIISSGVGKSAATAKQQKISNSINNSSSSSSSSNNINNSISSVPAKVSSPIKEKKSNTSLKNDVNLISSDINSSNLNSLSNSILNNSTTTTATTTLITSNLKTQPQKSTTTGISKPQTPAKPASLLNHQPQWKGAYQSPTQQQSQQQSQRNSLTNTTKLQNSISSPSSSSLPIITATTATANKIDSPTQSVINSTPLSSNKLVKIQQQTDSNNKLISNVISTSNDLLDEVRREEERLINALKTGIVLNNNNNNNNNNHNLNSNNSNNNNNNNNITSNKNNKKLPEVIQLSLVDKNPITSNKTSRINKISDISRSSEKHQSIKNSISGDTSKCNEVKSMEIESANNIITTNITSQETNSNTSLGSSSSSVIKLTKMRPKNDAAVPHPEQKSGLFSNSNNSNNLIGNRTNLNNSINPVRPFLTRGSVAERVMMFEKCPDVSVPMRSFKREPPKTVFHALGTAKISDVPIKDIIVTPKLHAIPKPEPQSHTTLQRAVRANQKNVYIPRFFYPHGKPAPNIAQETIIQRLKSAFDSYPSNQCSKDDFPKILKICNLPYYWRMPFISCSQVMCGDLVDGYRFVDFWKQMAVYCHDTESRFIYILSRGQRSRPYVLPEDLAPLVQDVVDNHPGLAFLKEASEFHSRYVHTVIARIFYTVNRSWSGRITVSELRRSNLLQVIQLLEDEEDINQIMAYFSYEHFYVIYCKFWELDRDHDLFIDQNDLARHNDHALSTRIIERIFSGCVTRGGKQQPNGPNGPKMSYTDFVWFLLSEEDKTNPTSIEYWFRCMDLDGDGIISMYELEYFYEEQQQRMESIGIETLPFEDCLCQMLDMVKPSKPGCVTLTDLKRCRMTPIFFDTFFNLEKYLEHEQRDPFANQRDNDDMSDWDRYAAQEYELLVAEEGENTQGSYEEEDDDYESNIDILESQLDDMTNMINEW